MLVWPTTAVGAAVALPREAKSAEPVQGAVLPPANGANAPADNPAHAETLPARALRPDLPRGRDGPAADGADSDEADSDDAAPEKAETPASPGAPAAREPSRGTPGMSQPGSVITASLRRETALLSTDHTFDYTGA